ncbi:MAG: L-gulono,4-lactone dehydrogenase [Solirubrobacteraceae bacterium]|nr:L-gulono,4-lactone dehydrogenase [Solirubrobacteraceae bacterium]
MRWGRFQRRYADGVWRNWSRELSCVPAAIEHPESREDVVAAVRRAAGAGRAVRVAGAGHSFTELVPTDGTLLLLDRMDRVLDVDRASGLVRVEAGITIHELSAGLAGHGLALENLGDIDVQSIAGAMATATHGTGRRLGNIPSQVVEVELVTGEGEVVCCSAEQDTDAWRAARVSLGALGVITAVTLRCVPAFTLRGVDRPAPLEETLDALDELVDGNEHFEFFTFPHSPLALTRTNNRADALPAPPGRAREWAEDILLGNHVFGTLCRLGRRFPDQIPQLNRLVSRVAGSQTRLDRSDRVFASPRLVRFTEMEYALPREHAAAAVRGVRELIDARGFHVNFPIELRFVAGDDALLSPAHDRDTAYVAVHTFEGMDFEPYFRAVEELMDGLGGRPHWGKRHFQTAATLRDRYPEWDRFAAVRARLDPAGLFANAHVERVLGPVGAPVGARTS